MTRDIRGDGDLVWRVCVESDASDPPKRRNYGPYETKAAALREEQRHIKNVSHFGGRVWKENAVVQWGPSGVVTTVESEKDEW